MGEIYRAFGHPRERDICDLEASLHRNHPWHTQMKIHRAPRICSKRFEWPSPEVTT